MHEVRILKIVFIILPSVNAHSHDTLRSGASSRKDYFYESNVKGIDLVKDKKDHN